MKKILLLLILSFVCLFSVVACGDDTDKTTTPETPVGPQLSDELRSAQSYLKQMYEKAAESTPADYVRPGKAAKCGVVWTVEVTSGNAEDVKVVKNEDGTYTIDVNEMASADVTYVLTATITDTAGNTTTLAYNHKLPKFKELSYAEYAAKEKGDSVVVKGIVVGILSKDYGDSVNALYLHTEEGGFYIYGMEENPKGKYEMGMEVRATGEFDNYNGTLEVKNATCEILNATPVAVTPVDLTEAYKAAEDLKADSILGKQSMLVTLKGVTIGAAGENGYYYFELDGLKTYMRVSSSTCPLNAEDTTTFVDGWLAHSGWVANVTGVVSIYNGNFYLQPCDANAVEYVSLPQLSEAETVAYEKDNLELDVTKFSDGVEVQLPVAGGAYSNVSISWASESAEVTVNADGLATVATGGKTVNVKLVATLTLGATTLTKEFTFEISAEPDAVNTTIGALVATKPTTEKDLVYIVTGTWSAKDGMEPSANTYGNGFLTDEAGNQITIYGLSSSKSCLTYSEGAYTYKNAKDFPTLNITDGAIITVGMVYTIQYDNYSAYLIEVSNEPAAVKTSIAELVATKPTTEKDLVYVVTGTWTAKNGMAPADNTYGNGFLTDEAGNQIVIYGLSSSKSCLTYAEGAYAYKNAKDFPTLNITDGAVLTVGMIYTIQYDNYSAYLISAETGSTPTPEPDPTPEPEPTPTPEPSDVITSIADALAAAEGAKVELTGTISDIYQAYNPQYGNISVYIKDAEGNKILAFRVTGTGAESLAIGDTIKVTGTITPYNEINQIAQGCTFEMISVHTCDYAKATCVTPATCKYCGKTTGEVSTEHNYVDGTCTDCKAVDPNYEGEVAELVTASKTVKALITEYGWTNTTTKQTFNLDDNVTVKVNGGSNTGKAYNGDHIRIYATDTPAGTLTISVPEGYELVSIKISTVTGTYAFLCVDGTTTDICNQTVMVSGNSVVLNSVKNGGDGKQIRVTAIEVVYQAK